MQKEIVQVGEKIYRKKEEEIEKKYRDKIIAIDPQSGEICGSGDSLTEAAKDAQSAKPEGKFYFKKVGSSYTSQLLGLR